MHSISLRRGPPEPVASRAAPAYISTKGQDWTGVFMVRRNNEATSGADKAKIRVFFAEVEGNNESVQEALKTMLSAMSRPVRVISEHKANGNAAVLLQHADADVAEEPSDQDEEIDPSSQESAPPNARKARGTGKKVYRNAGLKLVPDLNFRINGNPTLKAFVDEKSPKNDLEAALALVYYMQHVMELAKIGPPHVMTAFKEVGKPFPAEALSLCVRGHKM
jgi:hypothetical protein